MKNVFTFAELINNTSFILFCCGKDPQPKAYWEEYQVTFPEQRAVVARAKLFVTALHNVLEKEEAAMAWAELETQRRRQPTIQPLRPTRRITTWAGSAAAVLIAVISAFYFLKEPAGSKKTVTREFLVYQSAPGERKTVLLPDSTRVILRGNSRVSITNDYAHENRSVRLEGDAFFDIAQQPGLPFSVHSDAFVVTALGTSFWIDGNGKKTRRVGLLDGKIKIDMPGLKSQRSLSIVLNPGQMLEADSALAGYASRAFNLQLPSQWLAQELQFRDANAWAIAQTLTDWYGTPVLVQGKPSGHIRFNGKFKDEPLDKVVQVISFSTGAKIEYRETSIILTF